MFVESINTSIALLEDPHSRWASGNGATLWDAALVLTAYLSLEVCGNNSSAVEEGREHQQLTFIELGAGLGLPGIAMYAQGHAVVSTERPLTLKLLEANIRLNLEVSVDGGCSASRRGGSIQSFALEWSEFCCTADGGTTEARCDEGKGDSTGIPLRERLSACLAEMNRKREDCREGEGTGEWDVVLGSDLIFPRNEESWPALAAVWDHLLSPPRSCTHTRTHRREEAIQSTHDGKDFAEIDARTVGDKKEAQVHARVRGFLSYEDRGSEVIERFSHLLRGRGIRCQRCFSNGVHIPNDIHIYELCKFG